MKTVNHEYYVSLEVAKLLKEAGFDWPCNHAICCDSTHYPNLKEGDVLEYNHLECSELMEGKKPHMLLCPTLDVAQRWLREVKDWEAQVAYGFNENGHKTYVTECGNPKGDLENYIVYFSTYEEALEACIKKALKIILERKESNYVCLSVIP